MEELVPVRLSIQVSRGADGRLDGSVVLAGSDTSHGFSGTLELLKILEDLVPPGDDDEVPGERRRFPEGDRDLTVPRVPGPRGPGAV
jgi:hypothetical protein